MEEKLIGYLKGELDAEETRDLQEQLVSSPTLRDKLERSRELLDLVSAASEERVVRTVHSLIQQAIECGAREIHVEPRDNGAVAFFRVGEVLEERVRFPREMHAPVIDQWKKMSDCQMEERSAPQHGRVGIRYREEDYDLFVTFLPTLLGERVTARLEPWASGKRTLETLGLSASQIGALRGLLLQPPGLIAVAGPVGSGQADFLRGMLQEWRASTSQHAVILSIEESGEVVLPGVCQIIVDPARGMTYAAALSAALRSNPEILIVGDLPDAETAKLALRGAAEGRRVIAGVVGRGAAGGMRRLCELSGDPALVAQALVGAVGLRRVRRVCAGCAREYRPAPEMLRLAALSGSEDGPFRHGEGCAACRNTGYQGSVHLVELLVVEEALRPLIGGGASEDALQGAIVWGSVPTLWDDAREKIRHGVTTVEEARRALLGEPPPQLGGGRPLLPTGV
jgi:type II secretory ATPase GspE/PulE/Tfp pilus assembly ATPase PilB-like protein